MEVEDSWRWVRPAILRKGWEAGGEGGQESEDEGEEGVGGDRGGEIGDGGESDGGDTGGAGDERTTREEGRGTGGQSGRILTRAPMGLRLRWMIEGKGPPWAQQR